MKEDANLAKFPAIDKGNQEGTGRLRKGMF
jgi:hypothetical protein